MAPTESTRQKVAVVTGANKGVGFAVVQGLCEKFDGIVYLTCRDEVKGMEALDKLRKMGHEPRFYKLDIIKLANVQAFADHLKNAHGGLDILINNAARAYKVNDTEKFVIQALETVRTNYMGTVCVCQNLFPILFPNARVVNVSSAAGHLSRIPPDHRISFADPNLTENELTDMMDDFVQSCAQAQNVQKGWGSNAYVVSKVGVAALTVIQQRVFDKEVPNRNIIVNHVHPGYIDTDLTSHKGHSTIYDGAKPILYAALETKHRGQFIWCDNRAIEWNTSVDPKKVYGNCEPESMKATTSS